MGRVELLGRPGSGKTTVAIAVNGTDVPTQGSFTTRGWLDRVKAVGRRPILSTLLYLSIGTRKHVTRRNIARVLVIQKAIARMSRASSPSAVIDEGPVHALHITMFGTSSTLLSTALLRGVIRILCRKVTHYVLLDVSPEECISRFQERDGLSRFNRTTPDYLITQFRRDETYQELLNAIVRTAPSKIRIARGADDAISLIHGLARGARE